MTDRATVLEKAEAGRVSVLERAWGQALAALNQCTDATQLAALSRAEAQTRAALAAARAEARAAAAGPAPEPEATYPTQLAAYQYLREQGWRCSRSKFSRDLRAARIKRSADGTFAKKELDTYGAAHCAPVGGREEGPTEISDEYSREKVLLTRAQRRERELKVAKLEGSLIPRDRVEAESAAKAQVFRADLRNVAHAEAPRLARMDQPAEIQAHLLDQFDEVLARYAEDRDFVAEMEVRAP